MWCNAYYSNPGMSTYHLQERFVLLALKLCSKLHYCLHTLRVLLYHRM